MYRELAGPLRRRGAEPAIRGDGRAQGHRIPGAEETYGKTLKPNPQK
jgi:hypothetical protein